MKQPDPSPKIKKHDPKNSLARKKAKLRTDAAGRSGMGETAGSNIRYKDSPSMGPYKPALRTGQRASQDSGKSRYNSWNSTPEGISSVVNAHKYAYDRKQAMNPRRDNSGYGEAGFGRSKPRSKNG